MFTSPEALHHLLYTLEAIFYYLLAQPGIFTLSNTTSSSFLCLLPFNLLYFMVFRSSETLLSGSPVMVGLMKYIITPILKKRY